jgi:hypothetical protein
VVTERQRRKRDELCQLAVVAGEWGRGGDLERVWKWIEVDNEVRGERVMARLHQIFAKILLRVPLSCFSSKTDTAKTDAVAKLVVDQREIGASVVDVMVRWSSNLF